MGLHNWNDFQEEQQKCVIFMTIFLDKRARKGRWERGKGWVENQPLIIVY